MLKQFTAYNWHQFNLLGSKNPYFLEKKSARSYRGKITHYTGNTGVFRQLVRDVKGQLNLNGDFYSEQFFAQENDENLVKDKLIWQFGEEKAKKIAKAHSQNLLAQSIYPFAYAVNKSKCGPLKQKPLYTTLFENEKGEVFLADCRHAFEAKLNSVTDKMQYQIPGAVLYIFKFDDDSETFKLQHTATSTQLLENIYSNELSLNFEKKLSNAHKKSKPFKKDNIQDEEFKACIQQIRSQLLKLDILKKYPLLNQAYQKFLDFLAQQKIEYNNCAPIFNALFRHLNLIDKYDEYGVFSQEISSYYRHTLAKFNEDIAKIFKQLEIKEQFIKLKDELCLQSTQPLTNLIIRNLEKHETKLAKSVKTPTEFLESLNSKQLELENKIKEIQHREKNLIETQSNLKQKGVITPTLDRMNRDSNVSIQLEKFISIFKENTELTPDVIIKENKLHCLTRRTCPEIYKYKQEKNKPKLMRELTSDLHRLKEQFYNPPEHSERMSVKQFYESIDSKIHEREKPLSIPRKIWRPLFSVVTTTLLSLTLVGLAYTAKKIHTAIKEKSFSPLVFGRTKSREVCDAASKKAQQFKSLVLS